MSSSPLPPASPATVQLTISKSGSGSGTITSTPPGINCGTVCNAVFNVGTAVTLTATPGTNSVFAGWSGTCAGTGSCTINLSLNTSISATFSSASYTLSVAISGTGTATITSTPAGINCGSVCSANFVPGTQVNLASAPSSNSYLVGWGGACLGTGPCAVTLNGNQSVTATINIWPINHIIFLAQENRSLDHYFGELRRYWLDNGYPDQSFDGLPQFNPTSGAAPLYGPPPSNPGCDPNSQPPNDCVLDSAAPVVSYHLITQCVENPSPSWNESHVDWDYNDPTGLNPAALNGFVYTAAHDARKGQPPFNDVNGVRAMGYYDGGNPNDPNDPGDLNYYYFMASQFATSDRWFNPVMTRTAPNREYLIAATSQGYVYPIGTNPPYDSNLLTATTIFQELQGAGISWKIYVNPTNACSGPPYQPSCLLTESYVQNFQWGQTIPAQYPHNLGTIGIPGSDFDNDLENSTLPQVVQVEPASAAGLDEHPSDSDTQPSNSQAGANYVSSLIGKVMNSSYWKDSVFILTFDEFGGFYDHVPPQPTVSPDGIKPVDLFQGPPGPDVCVLQGGPTCDFTYIGYRVPLLVISPYAKKNYVSHTVADTTSILKFIETRFGLSSLTARDAVQMDMSEFFDFNTPPWMSPPTPPLQNTNGQCYLNKLP